MNIALVAHDKRKEELLEWVKFNDKELSKHELYATGTTGRIIQHYYDEWVNILKPQREACIKYNTWKDEHEDKLNYCSNVKVNCLLSGPLGGDSQIGAMIAEGKIDCLIFFCDNLITQGHQQDVGALSRLASLYNIPFATNRTTADMLITSILWNNNSYKRNIPRCIEDYKNRNL